MNNKNKNHFQTLVPERTKPGHIFLAQTVKIFQFKTKLSLLHSRFSVVMQCSSLVFEAVQQT